MPVEEQFVHLYTDQLLPNTPYQVRVTACDSWGNESVLLMWDFRTPKRTIEQHKNAAPDHP